MFWEFIFVKNDYIRKPSFSGDNILIENYFFMYMYKITLLLLQKSILNSGEDCPQSQFLCRLGENFASSPCGQ